MGSKKPLTPSQLGTSVTIEVLKDPATAKKKHSDMNKKPNIPLFHIGTWFSLKMDVRRAELQNFALASVS